ncbi:MAG: carbohydrate kinase [Clostridia bacterium]|nr:carbohydrate kinase [Clostridia bacterium]
MILSIGEILAGMVSESNKEGLTFKAFVGGAPFNVAVNAKRAGAKVGFISRIGKDVIGRFCKAELEKFGLDYLDLQQDESRNTTIAFVTLTDGERDFAFNRHDTADYNIDFDEIDFSKYKDLKIIHLGSLMLSENAGKALAEKVVKKAKELNVKLSFDLNFRTDIFGDFDSAKAAYKPYIENADILKFSDDELKLYTGIEDINTAIKSVARENQLITITLGSRGSTYYYNGISGTVATEKVKPVDTTGAGDAFFGTFLANIEGKEYTEENIVKATEKANKAGARATQFLGAIKI